MSARRCLSCVNLSSAPYTLYVVCRFSAEGRYAEIQLEKGEGTQVIVKKVVKAPLSGAACVAFTHRRDVLPSLLNATTAATTTTATNNTLPELQVSL